MIQTLKSALNKNSRIPVYRQIVNCVTEAIAKGELKAGDKIPSINVVSEVCYLSRDTVEKAYKHLRSRQSITSVKGKGYYISKIDEITEKRVLFMFNKSSTYKMIVYDSIVNTLGVNGHVDMDIYHCDEQMFIDSLKRNLENYDYFVVMPHFKDKQSNHVPYTDNVIKLLDAIPQEKLVILDNIKPGINSGYNTIYQDFTSDLYNALQEGLDKIRKYDKIVLVYPSKSTYPYPKQILEGFLRFCNDFNLDHEVLDEIYDDMDLQKDVYITIQERDLVDLVQQIRANNLIMGTDIGIISYNETPLKALLGITVVSTDFKALGRGAAELIMKKQVKDKKNPFNYIERNSL